MNSPALGRTESGSLEADAVFDQAAEVFKVMAAPIRLKIISALCHGEKNVTELIKRVALSRPDMSQHLGSLYRGGVLARRRTGSLVFYWNNSTQGVGP